MKKNVVFMILSMFSVQGAAYLAQLLLAGMLQPDQFAIVRTVEAALQLLSALAPMGLSLLVVRLAAQAGDASFLRRQLTSYLLLVGLAGLAIAAVSALFLKIFGTRVADAYLLVLVSVLLLSNLSRTALNFLYGREQFALISLTAFAMSLGYLVLLVVFVDYWGLDGWVAAKYLVELLFVLVALFFVRPYLTPVSVKINEACVLFTEGFAVSLSLVFRSTMDNLPLLALAYLSANQVDIAMYGLCTLLVAAGMVIPASVNSVLLPKYASLVKEAPAELAMQHKRFSHMLLGVGSLVATMVMCAGVALPWIFVDKYAGILPLLSAAVLVIPIKALTSLNGNLLFVSGQVAIGTKVNAGGVVLSGVLTFFLHKELGIWGVVAAAFIVEICAAIAFGLYATFNINSR